MAKKQKTPEPTFKSDVDNMVSGVKKFNDKVNDTTRPVRKILEKAAGKEEQGIIGQYTNPNEYSRDNKAKGIDLKAKGIDIKDKVIPMTKEDAEVINTKEFKKASEATKDMKKGGKITAANYDKEYGKIYRKAVKKMASGGSVGSASKRADGIATKGKTRGKIC
jgi:hypothetical protein